MTIIGLIIQIKSQANTLRKRPYGPKMRIAGNTVSSFIYKKTYNITKDKTYDRIHIFDN
jgi:hypothetical protein